MGAKDYQVGGEHYRMRTLQPWDVVDAFQLDYYRGCALTYLLRRKGSAEDQTQDLRKAIHYLERLVELREPAPPVQRELRLEQHQ